MGKTIRRFKAIIFDMDGLMVDTERLYLALDHELASEFSKKFDEKLVERMMGQKPIDSMRIFTNSLNIDISPLKLLERRNSIFLKKLKEDLVPMNGLNEIVNDLYQKFKLAISTGAPQMFVDIILTKLRLQKYFSVIQTSDEIQRGKPDPEIYIRTVERLELIPNQCIVLEDSHNGALAAKRAGCYVIAIPSEYTYDQDFQFVDNIARDLIEAKQHILKIQQLE
ncbi:MAG: HAD family hydrolase [Candidatus Hodarchaeales archaeon]|jgi:HAD superfamily hydrolase (TIGR01509 family)